MNIMFVSVVERTKEIGMKGGGRHIGSIRSQFLTEAVILSLFGGILEVSFGVLGAPNCNRWLTTTVTLFLFITATCVLLLELFSVLPRHTRPQT